jgi:hypothetical protein
MFLLTIVVFGSLRNEKSPHLKRQVNIVFLLLIIINKTAYFILFISFIWFFAFIIYVYLVCVSILRVKEHYKWYQGSFMSKHSSIF